MNEYGSIRLQPAGEAGMRFEARFASGHATTFDSGTAAAAPSPVEHLIGSVAACEAMDVLHILRKKRLEVTGYEVAMSGERSEAHPRRFLAIELVHRVTGRGLPAAAVSDAVELSRAKYCSVLHTLDPGLRITNRIEILEG